MDKKASQNAPPDDKNKTAVGAPEKAKLDIWDLLKKYGTKRPDIKGKGCVDFLINALFNIYFWKEIINFVC